MGPPSVESPGVDVYPFDSVPQCVEYSGVRPHHHLSPKLGSVTLYSLVERDSGVDDIDTGLCSTVGNVGVGQSGSGSGPPLDRTTGPISHLSSRSGRRYRFSPTYVSRTLELVDPYLCPRRQGFKVFGSGDQVLSRRRDTPVGLDPNVGLGSGVGAGVDLRPRPGREVTAGLRVELFCPCGRR